MIPEYKWIILSALLYAAAFIASGQCFWFVFLFLIPLYWQVSTDQQGSLRRAACQGFVWGTIFFTVHLYALIYLLVQYTTIMQAGVVGSLLIGYCAAVAAAWFVVATALARYTTTVEQRLWVWSVVTVGYITVVDRVLLAIIGLPRGYVFAYPLVPLADNTICNAAAYFFPPLMLVICLCLGSACIVCAIQQKRIDRLCAACICFLPYGIGLIMHQHESLPLNIDGCIYVRPPTCMTMTPLTCAQAINRHIHDALQKFKQARCLLFPESTFPFPLDLYEDIQQLWADTALFAADTTLVVGGHCSACEKRKNTLFCLKQCRITAAYDKATYFPFVEYVPWPWNAVRFFCDLFEADKKRFEQSAQRVQSIELVPGTWADPYICSDLFFNYTRATDRAQVILWLVNDSWFACDYYRHLLFLFAKLQAAIYRRPTIYIGHEFGVLIPCRGVPYYLPYT